MKWWMKEASDEHTQRNAARFRISKEIVCKVCRDPTLNFFESVELEGWVCAKCWKFKHTKKYEEEL